MPPADVDKYSVIDGYLAVHVGDQEYRLQDKTAYRGFTGSRGPGLHPAAQQRLHIEIQIDPSTPVGKDDKAGVKDIILGAVTSIMDFEDSSPPSTPRTRSSATATGSAPAPVTCRSRSPRRQDLHQ